tara:strand:+ start:9078 stop:11795 length:2718 start_codon:yes stop_codon:yes gene_type:complete
VVLLSLGVDPTKAVSGSKKAQTAINKVGKQAVNTERSLGRLNKRMHATGRAAAMMRGGLGGAMGGLVGLAGAFKVVKTLGSFEESMARIKGVTGATTETLARMSATARELGATTSFTATQSADAMLILSRAGLTASESIAAVKNVLNLALVANIGMAEAADITANTLRQFGIEADQTARVVNTLTLVSNKSNTDITQLGEALKMAGPIANATGMSLETTTSVIGVLSDAGIKATLAGTGLRGMLVALMDPSDKAALALAKVSEAEKKILQESQGKKGLIETMKALGVAEATATDMVHIFNRRAAASGIVLKDNAGKVENLTAALAVMGDIAAGNAKLIGDTLPHRFKALVSAIEETILATGDQGLGGAIKSTVNFLTTGIRAFDSAADGMTRMEREAMLVVRALGIAGLLGAVMALAAALKGPLGILLLVGGVVSALIDWADSTEIVTDELKRHRQEVKGLGGDLRELQARYALAMKDDNLEKQLKVLEAGLRKQNALRLKFQQLSAQNVGRRGPGGATRTLGETVPMTGFALPSGGFDATAAHRAAKMELDRLQAAHTARNLSKSDFVEKSRAISSGLSTLGMPAKDRTAEQTAQMEKAIGVLRLPIAVALELIEKLIKETEAKAKALTEQMQGKEKAKPMPERTGFGRDPAAALADKNKILAETHASMRLENHLLNIELKDGVAVREREQFIIETANKVREKTGLPLLHGEADVLRKKAIVMEDLIRNRERELEAMEQQARTMGIIAQSVIGPLQNALLSGDWDNIGEQIIRQLQASLLAEALGQASKEFIKEFATATKQANGGVFVGGNEIAFARGGVVSGATRFGMAGGRTGIMGEAGPEAIMPLRRGRDGKLGVASQGSGTVVNDNRNITIQVRDDQGFRRTMRQLDRDTYKRMNKGVSQ